MSRFALIVLAFALSACSNSGNPYGNGGATPGQPGNSSQNPGQPNEKDSTEISVPAGDIAVMGNAWCTTFQQDNKAFQLRLNFPNIEDFDMHDYDLSTGSRGAEIPNSTVQGNYQLNGQQLTLITTTGKTLSFGVNLDLRDAKTGAKKLHLVDGSGDTAFDPCI